MKYMHMQWLKNQNQIFDIISKIFAMSKIQTQHFILYSISISRNKEICQNKSFDFKV